MGSVMVVVDPPSLDDLASSVQSAEQVLVEAFVAEATIEALDETILHRLSPSDVVPLDGVILLPLQDRSGGQLRAVVADDHQRPSALAREPLKLAGDADTCSEVSATSARHSRVKSSTTTRTRNRRPSARMSETKSRLQRWFGPCGKTIGARVPSARLRPLRRRTLNRSSR